MCTPNEENLFEPLEPNKDLPGKPKERPNDVHQLVQDKRAGIMQSDEVQELGAIVAEEGVKANLKKEAQNVRKDNLDAQEQELDNDLRDLELSHRREEEQRRHEYRMKQIKVNAKHEAMLDRRAKMEEKYGYLYKQSDPDEKGKTHPVNFSYSRVVNWLRTLARNFDRLDAPIKTFLKFALVGALIIGGIALLKHFNIL